MWVKEPNKPLGESLNENVNFLYNEGKVYIMDNHLCAAWCWLKQVDIKSSFDFIHIDRHYDLLGFPHTIETQITNKGIEIHKLTFEEYLNLKQLGRNNAEWQMFRWDNYIINTHLAYPTLFAEKIFATQRDGTINEGFVDKEFDFLTLANEIDYWLESKKWIVNLDIDYFFNRVDDKLFQIFSDEYIVTLVKKIKKNFENITVLTIALSPECCGGWEESFRIMKIICDILEVNFIEELNK
ncbi:peptide arginase family protein [Flavobacterium tructae]|uniref:Uncharacterized protein n=1 Tax=Flavobacterium tructae TaxID=1114873 RepID=A0A1S1J1M2_9FLAO|nr:UPF0489 family protein [Flavobacterium tructae]OHT43680.1 hypothetical protein BHE19_18085 [Flavobacterium tructae]OXB15911.1 hypothetical protein B0A71_20110 [Flavobacterium tructae]